MTKIFDAARSATAVVLALFFAQVLPAGYGTIRVMGRLG